MTVLAQARPSTAPGPMRSSGVRMGWTWLGVILASAIVVAVGLSLVGEIAYQKIPTRLRMFTAP